MTSEIGSLLHRVANLEQENRPLKMIGIAATILLVALVFAGAGKTPRTIEAEKMVRLDSHGSARLTIGTPAVAGTTMEVNSDDPVVWLADDKGTDRAMLRTGGLFFANGKARPIVSLSKTERAKDRRWSQMRDLPSI